MAGVDRTWTVPEVAERLRVNPETVRRWLRSGKLRGVLMGGDSGGYRIPEIEVATVEEAGPVTRGRIRVTLKGIGGPPTFIDPKHMLKVGRAKGGGSVIHVPVGGMETMVLFVNESPAQIQAQAPSAPIFVNNSDQ